MNTLDLCDISCSDFACAMRELFGGMPDRPRRKSDELHYHKCPDASCARIWSHRESDFHNAKDHNEGHQCPVCGTEEFYKCTPQGKPL
jgi:hypothetical protein